METIYFSCLDHNNHQPNLLDLDISLHMARCCMDAKGRSDSAAEIL